MTVHAARRRSTPALPALFCALALLAQPGTAPSAAEGKPAYQVGEKLEPHSGRPPAAARTAPAEFREIVWDDLMPKSWDPAAVFKGLNLATLQDSDPRAMEALAAMQAAWKNAPVEAAMNGARVRIPGFVVPLERVREEIREFLLVPYFGACIHTPPPPANQIIHVLADPPLRNARTMDAVWVSGTLETVRADTAMGTSGYRLRAARIVPYEIPAR